MKRIFYYNINYFCNSRCLFCFSSSTGDNSNIVPMWRIIEDIIEKNMNSDDLVVINGGEPTLHPDFYNIIDYLISRSEVYVSIYTNGTVIDTDRIPRSDRIKLIIPIHGDEKIHDSITQNPGSYKKTTNSIRELQKKNLNIGVKFIINKALIDNGFVIVDFLEREKIFPNEVIIARQNVTTKSILNGVEEMQIDIFGEYVENTFFQLKNNYKLVFLDTPLCQLPEHNAITLDIVPEFFFSDYKNRTIKRNYYKQIMIMPGCDNCIHSEECKVMSSSYLTTIYDDSWHLKCE